MAQKINPLALRQNKKALIKSFKSPIKYSPTWARTLWYQKITTNQYQQLFLQDFLLSKYIQAIFSQINCFSTTLTYKTRSKVTLKIFVKPLVTTVKKNTLQKSYHLLVILLKKKIKRILLNKKSTNLNLNINIKLQINQITKKKFTPHFSFTTNTFNAKQVNLITAKQNAQFLAQLISIIINKKKNPSTTIKELVEDLYTTNSKINGLKVKLSGRLQGVEMATEESYQKGCLNLHTILTNIDYASAQTITKYGLIGIKIWINWNEEKYTK